MQYWKKVLRFHNVILHKKILKQSKLVILLQYLSRILNAGFLLTIRYFYIVILIPLLKYIIQVLLQHLQNLISEHFR